MSVAKLSCHFVHPGLCVKTKKASVKHSRRKNFFCGLCSFSHTNVPWGGGGGGVGGWVRGGASFLFLYLFLSLPLYLLISLFIFLFIRSFFLSFFLLFSIFLAPASKLFRVTWVNKLH